MEKFSQEDLKNILALIGAAQIKGSESLTVAILQQKLGALLTPVVKEEVKEAEK